MNYCNNGFGFFELKCFWGEYSASPPLKYNLCSDAVKPNYLEYKLYGARSNKVLPRSMVRNQNQRDI